MSVLNRMLQDLQARRAATGNVDAAVRATAAPSPQRRVLLWGVAGAVAAFGLAFGDWPMLLPANAARTPQPVAMAEPAVAEPAASASPAGVDRPAAARATPAPRPALLRRDAPAKPVPAPEAAAYMANLSMTAPPNRLPAPAPAPAAAASAASAASTAQAQAALPLQALAPARAEPAGPGRVDKHMSLPTPAQRAQALYRQGLELASTGQGRLGVQRLHEALQADPRLLTARLQAVALLFEQGRGAEADALAREGLVLAPDDAALVYLLARGLAGQGDTAGALALLERSPRLGADAFGLRAGLYSQQGDFKRALPDYEQAVRLQPGNSLWWLGLGVALESEGQRQQARQVYARAQGIGVDSHELNVFLDQKLRALQ